MTEHSFRTLLGETLELTAALPTPVQASAIAMFLSAWIDEQKRPALDTVTVELIGWGLDEVRTDLVLAGVSAGISALQERVAQ